MMSMLHALSGPLGERDESLRFEHLSGREEFPHLPPVGIVVSLLIKEAAELSKERSPVAEVWKSALSGL